MLRTQNVGVRELDVVRQRLDGKGQHSAVPRSLEESWCIAVEYVDEHLRPKLAPAVIELPMREASARLDIERT